jgi:outer membrane protein
MLRTRIILVVCSALVITGLFLLPKSVVEDDSQLAQAKASDSGNHLSPNPHGAVSKGLSNKIKDLRARYLSGSQKEKNAIFADSLASLYKEAGKFDSAAWFAGEASTFFKTTASQLKAGDAYYEAFTFAVDNQKQKQLASAAREYYEHVLNEQPRNHEVKTKLAMTYVGSSTPMKGIMMLREVLAEDPKNETALYDMGMLSVQSGQYDRAVERLVNLIEVNPNHIQGHLLLGVAYMNTGDKINARKQFEKVKELDKDPSVQATADSYLNDLK